MAQIALNQIILIIVAGVVAARVGRRLRVPEVIPLLVTGYVLGSDLLGLLKPEELGIGLDFLALFAVPLILFYDGMKTDVRTLRNVWLTVFSINTVAVVVTVVGIAFFSNLFLGLSWVASFLLGATLASTDPAAIIPVLRKLNINKRISTVLEAETALNDASAITLFLVVLGLATGGSLSIRAGAVQFLYFAVTSAVIGIVIGLVFSELFKQFKVGSNLVLASLVVLLVSYSVSETVGISSVITVVIAALIFRQFLQSPHVDSINRLRTLSVWEDLNFLAIAIIFLVLGSQVQAAKVAPFIGVGILIAVAFILIVRPLTIFVSMFFDKSFSNREKAAIAWLGSPRGSVSAALASIIMSKAIAGAFPRPEAEVIFNITLVVIACTITVTSLTASRAVKQLLGVTEESVEDAYRRLSTELKTMMIAWRRLREDWKAGFVSTKMHDEINKELEKNMRAIESQIEAITSAAPLIEAKARAAKIRELIVTQINALENAYEEKEITEREYAQLLEKFHSQLDTLTEIEEESPPVQLPDGETRRRAK